MKRRMNIEKFVWILDIDVDVKIGRNLIINYV